MPVTKTKAATAPLIDPLGQEFTLDFKDVNLDRTETGAILLPTNMSLPEGIFWLTVKLKELETKIAVNERIEGFPIDVAYALGLASMELFGIRELKITPGRSFFDPDTPPTFISVPVNSAGETVEVFIGRFGIPGADGFLETARDYNDALWIIGEIRQKDVPTLRRLLTLTKEKLRTHSLYKGKAIEVWMEKQVRGFDEKVTMANPSFMDVNRAPAELMLNRDIEDLLDAAVWRPIERTAQCRDLGISLKRTAMFYGGPGTGKSLAALETARLAQKNGWTFIYLKSVHDLKRVYPVALRYSPVVIFGEDVDLIVKHADADSENQDAINMINNLLDGVNQKTAEMMVILTTNYVERLPDVLLRPGRFDVVVEFFLPDRETAARLVRQYAGRDLDKQNFNEDVVGDALAGNQPATIHEVVKRAKLFSQKRFAPDYRGPLTLGTEDFLLSATSIAPHLKLLHNRPAVDPAAVEAAGEIVRSWADNASAVAEAMKSKPNGKDTHA